MGNTQQAKLNLEKAKRFSPNLVQVHTAFAHYYDTVDEPDLATKAYEHALSINSEDADTLIIMVCFYVAKKSTLRLRSKC